MQVPEAFGGVGIDDFRYNQIVSEELGVAGTGGTGLGLDAAQRHLPALLPAAYAPRSSRSAGCRASPTAS